MATRLNTKQIFALVIALILILGLYAAIRLAGQEQELRKKAASSGVQASLHLIPLQQTLTVGETKEFELQATFTGAESGERLDYFRTEFNFSTLYLDIPPDTYIDVSQSGFNRIFRVDGPIAANSSGNIVIELGASVPGNGPLVYNQSGTPVVLTIAKIKFRGKAVTSGFKPLSFLTDKFNSQLVNNQSLYLSPQYADGSYQVVAGTVTLNPTAGPPTVTPVPLPSTTEPTVTPVPLPSTEPSVTPGNLVCPPPCPVGTAYTRAQGNANCDSAVDLIDFGIWLDQFTKYVNYETIAAASRTADFNCSSTDVSTQGVDLNDFGIWLYYFSQYVNAQT